MVRGMEVLRLKATPSAPSTLVLPAWGVGWSRTEGGGLGFTGVWSLARYKNGLTLPLTALGQVGLDSKCEARCPVASLPSWV